MNDRQTITGSIVNHDASPLEQLYHQVQELQAQVAALAQGLPLTADVLRLGLRPGDVLVIRHKDRLSPEQMSAFVGSATNCLERLGISNPICFLDGSTSLEVLFREQVTAIEERERRRRAIARERFRQMVSNHLLSVDVTKDVSPVKVVGSEGSMDGQPACTCPLDKLMTQGCKGECRRGQ